VIPESLDAASLRWIILVIIAAIVVAMYLVMRFVRKMATRVVFLVILAVLGIYLFVERENLADCVDTCSCSLFGMDVEIPENRNTGNCR
jgi:TctA family transporter